MKLPYLKFWVADYIADTTHLSTTEHGAYLLLLCAYWRHQAPLKDCNQRLAKLTGLPENEWLEVRPTMLEFFEIKAGYWTQKRIQVELKDAIKKRKQKEKKQQTSVRHQATRTVI